MGACTCSVLGITGRAQVYNEQAFRYFLEIERKRSELSQRPFFLLLVDVKNPSGVKEPMGTEDARLLLSLLAANLRETDFIGWYRDQFVIGAVLTQPERVASSDVTGHVAERFRALIDQHCESNFRHRLNVRVFQSSAVLEPLSR
jgi:GGDEF domain-containing protein